MSPNSFRENWLTVLLSLLFNLAIAYILINYYLTTTWKDLLLWIVPWCLKLTLDISHAKSKERSLRNPSGSLGFFSRECPPLKANEIRVLVLLPSKNRAAPLQGRFEIHDLGNENEISNKADQNGYEALFYTRTTSPPMRFIVIDSKIFSIPWHLQRALFWLRHTHEERRLWADAICIKLPDLLETTTQVLLSPRIYKCATKAIVWIGEANEAEEEAYRPFLEALQCPSSFLLLIRSGGLAHVSGLKVLIKPLRRWELITRKRSRLCRELMLAGKISFKLGRYDFQCLLVALLMLHYNTAMRLPRSERVTDTLLKPDASAALRVKGLLIDYIEAVSDIDEEEQYDNGPFPKPWFALGSIEELLIMLRRSDKGSVSRSTLKNLSSLLDRACSQSQQDPNLSYQSEAYNTYGTLIKQMKKATHGHRLFKTARLSRLGLASPGTQKKDMIFFVSEHSALLTLRAFSPLSTKPLDSQQYYTLTGACYMGDNKYWSKVHPHLANVPLRTVCLMSATQEKEVQRNDKSGAKPSHLVVSSRVDSVHSNFGKDMIERTMKPNGHIENKAERPHAAVVIDKRYILSWTCVGFLDGLFTRFANSEKTCGHRGLDHYTEQRPGSVRELLETFQEHGISASMEAWDSSQSSRSAARVVFERLGMIIANICTWIRVCILAWLGIEKWASLSIPTMHPRLSDSVHDRNFSSKAVNGPTNGSLPSTSSVNADPRNSNQPLHTSTGPSTAYQATSKRQDWRSSSSTARTQVNSTNINMPEDFILLCIKVKRFLTNRHDLRVSTITRDRELFEALRREYHSKFRWAYRQFSFQTVQRMSFVKFTLHARQEVDGLVSDMPPETVKHYTCDPRKPDRTPALGSDFLMHRFSSPKDCFQDNICLRQFPKRIGERPTPGVDPDLYTGWGVHLEQDMDVQRICLVLFFGIASAGTFGLIWGICKKSLQDGFSIAGFVLGSEAIAVATLQLFLTFGAI